MVRPLFLIIVAFLALTPSIGATAPTYMFIGGKCGQLVIGDSDYSDQCNPALIHIFASPERLSFTFVAEKAAIDMVTIIGADGENPSPDTDIIHIHTIAVTTNGQEKEYPAKGICSYGKGRTTISCSGTSNELGDFNATFFPNGNESFPENVKKSAIDNGVRQVLSKQEGPTVAVSDLLKNCQRNFPDVSFTPLSSAFVKEGKFFINVSDGRNFFIEETEVDDGERFSIRTAMTGGAVNLLLDQARNLYGPFISGTAGRYDTEEDRQAAACAILYRSGRATTANEIALTQQQQASSSDDVEQGYSTGDEERTITSEWSGEFSLTVCNQTKRDIFLSFYSKYNNLVVDDSYVVMGWYQAAKNQCSELGNFPIGDFAFYAHDDQDRRWEGKDKRLCIDPSRFKRVYYDDYRCNKKMVRGFSRIDVTSDTYTINLHR